MKHKKKGRTFGRVKKQQVALMRSLTRSLILYGSITTTVQKAKEVRPFIEKLITHAKKNTVSSHRFIASKLSNAHDVSKKLHDELAKTYAKRNGGYTRIIRLGRRGKRKVEEAKIELV
jgi:large subunit ribosomal protein L17